MTRRAWYTGTPLTFDGDFPADLTGALLRAAASAPRAGVVAAVGVGEATVLTYPEFLDRARRILTGLRRLEVQTGDCVIVSATDDAVDYLSAIWACVLGGVRPVLAPPAPRAATDPAVRDLLGRTSALLGAPVVLCGSEAFHTLHGELRAVDVSSMTAEPPATDLHRAAPSDVVLLMMSSGSTGVPKLIQLTQRGLREFAAGTPAVMPVHPGDVMLNWLPLDHSGAFLLYHLLAVYSGCTNVHVPTDRVLADPLLWLDLIAEYRAGHSWAPNFAYRMVSRELVRVPGRRWDLSCVRTLVSGGEQITVPVVREFLRSTAAFGIRPETFLPVWGMTETVTAITFARPGLDPNICETDPATSSPATFVAVGAPAPGAVVRIVDAAGETLPEGRIGNLQVSSGRVTPGYLHAPGEDARAFAEDAGLTWLDTGDLAFGMDGQVVVTGRGADRLVLRGLNYHAHEIEDAIDGVPGVLPGLVAACGIPDEQNGTDALAVFVGVEAKDAVAGVARAVRDRLFQRFGLRAGVVVVPRSSFPRTAGGKVRRAALRQRLLTGELTFSGATVGVPSAETDRATDLRDTVQRVFRAVLGTDVDERAPFYEVGIDSVLLVRLHAALEHDLGRRFPRSAMFEHSSQSTLIRHLIGAARPGGDRSPRPEPTEHRVAIIGMAGRFPGAGDLEQFWRNLAAGVTSIRRATAEERLAAGAPDDDDFVPVTGALSGADEFDAGFFGISPAEAARTDPAHRLFLQSCYHALENAGYAGASGSGRIGVFAGTGMNLYHNRSYLDGNLLPGIGDDPLAGMQAAIGNQPDFLATRVAYQLGLTGPAVGVQTACSTSLVAVHLAVQAILTGDADMALAGAAAVSAPHVVGYQHFPGSVLSPTGQCRAFDAGADGTVGGNGTAAVVLKRLDRAIADGDTIHAVILGSAINNDGAGKVGFTAPGVAGQAEVIGRALDRAQVPAETITYLEAHGTGTPLGDPVELHAAARVFADRTDKTGFCTVGSVKPNIGHLDSCAGMAGLIKTVLMFRHRTLVPLVGFQEPNPDLDLAGGPLVLGTTAREWTTDGTPRRAGVTALGVGGTNAHVVLEEAPTQHATAPEIGTGHRVLPLSAADPAALAELAGLLRDRLRADPGLRVADLVTTMALGRPHLRHRGAVTGSSPAGLADALARFTGTEVTGAPPVLAFAFGGQGSDLPGTTEQLRAAFPRFRAVLDECERIYRDTTGDSLLAHLRTARPNPAGRDTAITQPALFAIQMAQAELWRSFGVEPSFVLGHSAGEYAALCTAGAMTIKDGMRLVIDRGRLMRETAPGTMIAVFADRDAVEELFGGTTLEIAAVNGPREHVLAGPADAAEDAGRRLDDHAVPWHRLDVERAFHTKLMDPILDRLAERVAATPMSPLRVPVVSTRTGRVLSPGTMIDVDHLRGHTRSPVLFDEAIRTLLAADCQVVLDLSPGAVLTGMIGRSQPGVRCVPVARESDPAAAVHVAAGELYQAGADLRWSELAGGGRRVPLPGYPFRHNQHWISPPATGSSTTVEDAAGQAHVLSEIRKLVAQQLGTDAAAVRPDTPFLELGADSLSMLRVVRQVRLDFGVEIPVRRLFTDTATPAALCAVITGEPTAAKRERPHPATADPAPATADPVVLTSEPSGETTAIATVISEQLRVADRLIDNVTSLLRDQLRLLEKGPVTPARPTGAALPSPQPVAVPAPRPPVARQQPVVEPVPAGGTGRTADFSLYFFGDYPHQDDGEKYAAIIAAARFADERGFHGLWMPERHFHSFGGLFPNPVVLAAALARETSRIRLNAGSVVLPLHNPVRVAEEWSVVDNLSGGRVGLCVASGWHANDFALNPQAFGQHRDLMYDQLETLRTLWSGAAVPSVSGSGERFDLRVYPRPVQKMPPLSVAVVSNPDSYRAAASADLGVVTNLMTQSIDELAENIALYRRCRAEHGFDPGAGRVTVLVHTYLGTDLETAKADAYHPFIAYLRSSISLFGQVTNSLGLNLDDDLPEEDVDFLLRRAYERYCGERALIGTVESTGTTVDRLTSVGVDEIACFVDFGLPADLMLASLEIVDEAQKRHRDRAGSARAATGPAPVRFHAATPLSAAQQGIWFLDRAGAGPADYSEPKAIRLDGPLDAGRLRRALNRVVDRHAPLRTVFQEVDGEPRQIVRRALSIDCPLRELPGLPEDQALRDILRELTADPFDLAAGPLLRCALLRLGEERHVLAIAVHHIVFDSLSTAVLVRDLAAYYRGDTPEPLPTTYPEHVLARAGDEDGVARSREYWQKTLAGASSLRLPVDRAVPAPDRGAALSRDWDAELSAAVRQFSRRHGVTPFMTLFAAVAGVLGRFGGQEDLVLGTVLTSRPPDTENLVGLFIDTVPLRLDLSGDPTLAALAGRVRDVSTAAYEHAGIGFAEMVTAVNPDRTAGRNPLFQVLVEYETAMEVDFDPPGVRATVIDVPTDRAPLDLTIYLSHRPDGLRCLVEYNAGLLPEQTVRTLLRYLEVTLRRAVAAPDRPLSELSAPTEADRVTLASWSASPSDEAATRLDELVERQVRRTPEATALITDEGTVTYRELDRRANALAWRLHGQGVGPEDIVAVLLPRGVDLVVALLGVFKAGAAYLPLDRVSPESRLAFLTADSGARLVLTDDENAGSAFGLPVFDVRGDDPRADRAPAVPREPNLLAYVIYTSGSTGTPKGVEVEHAGPANLVSHYLRNRPALRTLQWTSPSFDVSVQEIFTTLSSGAALVLIADTLRYEPSAVSEVIRRHGVERVFMTYSALKYLMEGLPSMPSLREIVAAGEQMVVTPALRSFLRDQPACTLYNEYGPTEASIIATIHRVDPDAGDRPPIGHPVSNVHVHILDRSGRPLPPGAAGEIHLGGRGLARGYTGRPAETAEAFLSVPAVPGERLYRTRDRGRWTTDGNLEFLGRSDDQIKIRGFRVEPGEATTALLALPGVHDAAVVSGADLRGETHLIGYVVMPGTRTPGSGAALTERLNAVLPGYLVPTVWVFMDNLPVTAAGKLDRAALPAPATPGDDRERAAPVTELERALHDLWCADLSMDQVPVDASYFHLGGHSLTAVGLVSRIRDRLGVELSVTTFLHAPTIRRLAEELDRNARVEIAPASSIQRRAWDLHHAGRSPAIYNVAHRIDLDGPFDVEAMRRAFARIAGRHAALRTFFEMAGDELRQVVLAGPAVDLALSDLSDGSGDVDAWCQADVDTPFDVDRRPPWRVRLARCDGDSWTMTVVMHHLICDGWSMGVLWNELSSLYIAEVTGTPVRLGPIESYPDYVRWRQAEQEANHARLITFWTGRLRGAPMHLPLPYDRPRPDRLSGRGALHLVTLPAETVQLVRRATKELAATPAALLTAAFGRWLGRLCEREDVVLAVSSSSRIRPEHAAVVGPVGEALLVRLAVPADASFPDLVHQASERTFEALDHYLLPIRDVGRAIGQDIATPQILFTVVTTPAATLDLPGVMATVRGMAAGGLARTELYVVLVPTEDRCDMAVEYSTDLFDRQTIETWVDDFLDGVTKECRSVITAEASVITTI